MNMTAKQLVELRASVVEHFRDGIARQVADGVRAGNIPTDMADVYLETAMASEPVRASIDAFVARHQGACTDDPRRNLQVPRARLQAPVHRLAVSAASTQGVRHV